MRFGITGGLSALPYSTVNKEKSRLRWSLVARPPAPLGIRLLLDLVSDSVFLVGEFLARRAPRAVAIVGYIVPRGLIRAEMNG